MENEEKIKETDVIREKLRDELFEQLENIHSLQPGSKELETTVNCVDKLYRLELEEKKNDRDIEKGKEVIESRKESDKTKIIEIAARVGLEGIGIITALIFKNKWMKKGFEFEKTGTITSYTFKDLIREFKLKR